MLNSYKRLSSKGWAKLSPKTLKMRNHIYRKCGNKCFLGKKLSFPICSKKSCKLNNKGLYAAYTRAKQYKYKSIASKSRKILQKRGFKFNQ